MRAIKVLTLEGHVVQKVEAARAAEFGALCRYQYLNGIQRSTYELVPVLVSLVTFSVHSLRGRPLELSVVMPALLLFQLLKFPMALIPAQLTAWVSANLSARRIDNFLGVAEVSEPPTECWCDLPRPISRARSPAHDLPHTIFRARSPARARVERALAAWRTRGRARDPAACMRMPLCCPASPVARAALVLVLPGGPTRRRSS